MDKNDKNLISLKEAAQISGYSADYIGQLIRAGKIPGKQVYVNIAWMTTAEAVMSYKKGEAQDKKESGGVGSFLSTFKRKIGMELQIMGLFFQTFKSAKLIIIILILSFLLLNVYIFYYLNHRGIAGESMQNNEPAENFSY